MDKPAITKSNGTPTKITVKNEQNRHQVGSTDEKGGMAKESVSSIQNTTPTDSQLKRSGRGFPSLDKSQYSPPSSSTTPKVSNRMRPQNNTPQNEAYRTTSKDKDLLIEDMEIQFENIQSPSPSQRKTSNTARYGRKGLGRSPGRLGHTQYSDESTPIEMKCVMAQYQVPDIGRQPTNWDHKWETGEQKKPRRKSGLDDTQYGAHPHVTTRRQSGQQSADLNSLKTASIHESTPSGQPLLKDVLSKEVKVNTICTSKQMRNIDRKGLAATQYSTEEEIEISRPNTPTTSVKKDKAKLELHLPHYIPATNGRPEEINSKYAKGLASTQYFSDLHVQNQSRPISTRSNKTPTGNTLGMITPGSTNVLTGSMPQKALPVLTETSGSDSGAVPSTTVASESGFWLLFKTFSFNVFNAVSGYFFMKGAETAPVLGTSHHNNAYFNQTHPSVVSPITPNLKFAGDSKKDPPSPQVELTDEVEMTSGSRTGASELEGHGISERWLRPDCDTLYGVQSLVAGIQYETQAAATKKTFPWPSQSAIPKPAQSK